MAEGGQLAAGDSQQAALLPDDVVARFVGRVGLAAADDRPDAGEGSDHVVERQAQGGEVGRDGGHQIGHFVTGDTRVGCQRRWAVDVGRADQGDALPRESEDRPAVERVHEADGLSHGEAPGGEDEVAAAQGADATFGADLAAQVVGPGAGGVDDGAGANVGCAAVGTVGHIAQADAEDSAGVVAQ